MGTVPEDLDQRDLECGDLAMHEDAGEIQLDLETDVHIRTIDGWRPPKREAPIRNLVQPAALRVCQLLVPSQHNASLTFRHTML